MSYSGVMAIFEIVISSLGYPLRIAVVVLTYALADRQPRLKQGSFTLATVNVAFVYRVLVTER